MRSIQWDNYTTLKKHEEQLNDDKNFRNRDSDFLLKQHDSIVMLSALLDSKHAQLDTHTVFHEESESEVHNFIILEPGGKH